MDLGRVFGDSAFNAASTGGTQAFFAGSGAGQMAPNGGQNITTTSRGDEVTSFHEAFEIGGALQDTVTQLNRQLAVLHNVADQLRHAYAGAAQERDQLRNNLTAATGRLQEVQRVVSRYAIVEDPVVASDGFTYERRVIEKYLEDCRQSKTEAISQQTKETLCDTLLPNQSLRKLVDLLKTVRPTDLAALVVPEAYMLAHTEPRRPGEEDDEARRRIATGPTEGRLHPCVRVYGFCNYKDSCTYANYPYDACLSHLKGKCRFGAQCHELHVDYRGKATNLQDPNRRPK